MQDLTLEHFVAFVDQDFAATTEAGDRTCFTLTEAQAAGSTPPGITRPPFALLFHNPAEVLFPQGTYRLSHPTVGEVEIFLVPVARKQPGFVYQAVFN
ncbi:DUF6916 family protein [Dyella caseinilytica]|uniref:DUF6916 domain-containing protein n=1 Tax=Dyella caseinilytica TaxID=1849581 RepID=A0ABX7GTT2_9GAMM|nr:hypothetical protein [Dyella caseinilytica]QRN53685.1 hypothetical protein ISN74_20195 [Dyella caseinilytica]GFZ88506.1 hypothetical protein GCM10011408_04000 [Dyella caseinilytica]